MTDRILEIAESPARVSLKLEAIEVEQPGHEPVRIQLEDFAVLVLSHPQVQVTSAALQAVAMSYCT